jgi:hypothetical protein
VWENRTLVLQADEAVAVLANADTARHHTIRQRMSGISTGTSPGVAPGFDFVIY